MGDKSGRRRERGQEEPEVRVMEEGAMAKGCTKARKWVFLGSLQKEHSSADALILAHFQISDLPNGEAVDLDCFKSLSRGDLLWQEKETNTVPKAGQEELREAGDTRVCGHCTGLAVWPKQYWAIP